MLHGHIYGQLPNPNTALLGSPQYWLDSIDHYASQWSAAEQDQLQRLRSLGARIAYWRSDVHGMACNGGNTVIPASTGLILTAEQGEPKLCTKTVLHATLKPPRWMGSRVWIVALLGEVIGDEDKFGARTRMILGEVKDYKSDSPT